MDTQSKVEAPAQPASVVPVAGLTRVTSNHQHFETFESHFFSEGDHPEFAERQVGFDEPEKWYRLSYRSLSVVSIASSAVAIAACLALFGANAPATTIVTAPLTKPTAISAGAAKVQAAPSEPGTAPAADPLSAPAPAPAAVAAIVQPPAAAAPAETPAPAAAKPAAAAAEPAPTPVAPAEIPKPEKIAAVATKAEVKAPEPTTPEVKVVQQPQAALPPVAAAANSDDKAGELCRQAIHAKRAKAILTSCTAQFEADATAADAAVAVARVEFDRGRFTQAYTWGKKAIAASPDSVDAYVFVGSAEQSQGHGKAAKEAYLHYLKLAPSGNYAADLRTIVKSL
jgi:hypothetical protein